MQFTTEIFCLHFTFKLIAETESYNKKYIWNESVFRFYVSCQHGNARIRCCGLAPCSWVTRAGQHTHTPVFPGLPRWAGIRKVKPMWILLKQETVSGNGISWTICKSAFRSRRTTMPAPHHSVFYRPINRYFVKTERSAANPPHRTDGPLHRPFSAYYGRSTNNHCQKYKRAWQACLLVDMTAHLLVLITSLPIGVPSIASLRWTCL